MPGLYVATRPCRPAGASARALTLLEILVASLCLAILLIPTLTFTRTTRELSRHRLVHVAVVRDMMVMLDLLAAEPVSVLRKIPQLPYERMDAGSDPLLDSFIWKVGPKPVEPRQIFSEIAGTVDLKRQATFVENHDRLQGLHLLTVLVSYRMSKDDTWTTVTASRLIARDL